MGHIFPVIFLVLACVVIFPCLSVKLKFGSEKWLQHQRYLSKHKNTYHMPSHLRDDYPFWDPTLPWDVRVNDLVGRLTLDEIQLQMARGGAGPFGGPAPAIPRLGIGAYNWDEECIHGVGEAAENATSFPQAIGLAATFSPSSIYAVAEAIGTEVRGKHNDFVKRGIFTSHTGASCFSPVVNIMRDPRWGRNQETYGEDPFLTGQLAKAYVTGLQGKDKRFVRASGGCKHFDVHGGPENIPVSRMSFNAQVSDRDWRMTFLPAFKKCVEAGVYNLMCSYNRLNGVPSCANKELLTDILRKEWNFTGYVVSDERAIENIITDHKYLNNSVDTVAACVNAGCNLELSQNSPQPVYLSLVDAVKQGKLSESLVRERVKPLFYTRMRLGEFDPPESNPYSKLSSQDVETEAHRNLARSVARESFVLLKNDNGILPLAQKDWQRVSIIGPMSDDMTQLSGDYPPVQDKSFQFTPLKSFKEIYPNAKYGQVCQDGTLCTKYNTSLTQEVVKDAQLVFILLGTGPAVEAEERDRADLQLPGNQIDLLIDVLKYNRNAKIVLLLFNACPLDIAFADLSPRVNAIMECFFPAQEAGRALTDVLFKDNGIFSPAGRLPSTWPLDILQVPPMVNYSMEGRTYRYFQGEALFPFGYGLSYSSWEYSELACPSRVKPTEALKCMIQVHNTGSVMADEVVQCYIEWADKSFPVPQRQLAYVIRVPVQAKKTVQLNIEISPEAWSFWQDGKWVVQKGDMKIHCGGQQPYQTRKVPSNIITKAFTITSSAVINTV